MKFEATDLNVLYLKYIQLNQNRIQKASYDSVVENGYFASNTIRIWLNVVKETKGFLKRDLNIKLKSKWS